LGQGTINLTFAPLPIEAVIEDVIHNVSLNESIE